MPIETVLFIIGGMLGFALGYWVRAGMSWRRHKRAVQRKMDSVAAPTTREPQFTLLARAEQTAAERLKTIESLRTTRIGYARCHRVDVRYWRFRDMRRTSIDVSAGFHSLDD